MDTGGGRNNSGEDPPPFLDYTTAGQILWRTTASFFTLFPTFLLLSFLLFFFHSFVDNGTGFLTSFIDRDPTFTSLLARLEIAGKNLQSSSESQSLYAAARHRRRRPFLHLTRVGTLDDDFFSGDDDNNDRSFFGSYRKARVNGSFLALSEFNSRLGFSGSVVDNGVKYPEVVKSGVSFKLDDSERNVTVGVFGEERLNAEENGVVDLRFSVAGLELGRRDAAALIFLISLLFTAYGWVILGFVITYSWVMGIVFVSVANDLSRRHVSLVESMFSGSKIGLKKLPGFFLMRWAAMDALTQVLGLWFFGEIEDQYSLFIVFLRLKLMPFSTTLPWIGGYQKEISGFLIAWFLMDTVVSFFFAVDSWVTIVNARRSGREIMKEGCNLLAMLFQPAVHLKCLEVILCGPFVRWGLVHICGRSLALIFQSLIEVYFMVAWLIFYFVVRNRDASLNGRTFGRRELEGLI